MNYFSRISGLLIFLVSAICFPVSSASVEEASVLTIKPTLCKAVSGKHCPFSVTWETVTTGSYCLQLVSETQGVRKLLGNLNVFKNLLEVKVKQLQCWQEVADGSMVYGELTSPGIYKFSLVSKYNTQKPLASESVKVVRVFSHQPRSWAPKSF